MDIKIPKVITTIDLGEYDAALSGRSLCVWVNPPMALLREHDELAALKDDAKTFEWYARILSQGADPATHWTAQELKEAHEADPAFWVFIARSIWQARTEHIGKKKRN